MHMHTFVHWQWVWCLQLHMATKFESQTFWIRPATWLHSVHERSPFPRHLRTAEGIGWNTSCAVGDFEWHLGLFYKGDVVCWLFMRTIDNRSIVGIGNAYTQCIVWRHFPLTIRVAPIALHCTVEGTLVRYNTLHIDFIALIITKTLRCMKRSPSQVQGLLCFLIGLMEVWK